MTDGARDWLGEAVAAGGEIRIATSLASYALQKKLGSIPVFLVTAGFENWLALNAPLGARADRRAPLPLSEDLVFGITERLRADGTVETALSLDDLQFLAAKLEMLKTKTIAVGLLHSDVNPEHEIRIRDYFRERGYGVFCSHEALGGTERERWLRAAYDAYVRPALDDLREQIEAALGECKDKWTLRFATSGADGAGLRSDAAFATAFGQAAALERTFGRGRPVLHLGLERFLLVENGTANVRDRDAAVPPFHAVRHRRLGAQPVSAIESGFWPAPTLGDAPKTFDPGPMALGKAHRPTVFDVLFALERLEPVDGVTPMLQERSRARILESIFTLSKAIAKIPDPRQVARDIETLVIERLNEDLLTLPPATGEIIVTGCLAKTLLSRIESRRPDLEFRLAAEADWAEAVAARDFTVDGDQVDGDLASSDKAAQ